MRGVGVLEYWWGTPCAARWYCCRCFPRVPARGVMSPPFENYTARFEIDKCHIELSVWDTLQVHFTVITSGPWPVLIQTLYWSALTLADQKHWTVSSRSALRLLNEKMTTANTTVAIWCE